MICPKCNKEFTVRPALSRKDNKTEICPECGIIEALESVPNSYRPEEFYIEVVKDFLEKNKETYMITKCTKFKGFAVVEFSTAGPNGEEYKDNLIINDRSEIITPRGEKL